MSNELIPVPPSWQLETIEAGDFELAKEIEACPEPNALVAALAGVLREAAVGGKARFCQEEATDARGGLRAVIQFQARRALFNHFFNGRAGYRAHFYASSDFGLLFNDRTVEALVAELAGVMPDQVNGFHIHPDGHETLSRIRKGFLMQSLVASLPKLWVGDGVSFTGPRMSLRTATGSGRRFYVMGMRPGLI
ncbi:hypothetical protein [Paraburkholderia sp. MM5477-R1]|uniref:hypothetical protein n=1 Tax=Paraburkholderia sp. MM5477-R1 TaxID=2991062 RepID=UPI003D2185D5